MSGICDTCRREHCHAKMDGLKSCDFHEGGETRYEKLFGTPERAALMAYKMSETCGIGCYGCPMDGVCDSYDALLEWLRGDA